MYNVTRLHAHVVSDNSSADLDAAVRGYSMGEALKKALSILLLGLLALPMLLAFILFTSVFMPGQNLILLPAALIVGLAIPIFGFFRTKRHKEVAIPPLRCSHCHTLLDIPSDLDRWPVDTACPACRAHLTASLVA